MMHRSKNAHTTGALCHTAHVGAFGALACVHSMLLCNLGGCERLLMLSTVSGQAQ